MKYLYCACVIWVCADICTARVRDLGRVVPEEEGGLHEPRHLRLELEIVYAVCENIEPGTAYTSVPRRPVPQVVASYATSVPGSTHRPIALQATPVPKTRRRVAPYAVAVPDIA